MSFHAEICFLTEFFCLAFKDDYVKGDLLTLLTQLTYRQSTDTI